MKKKAKGSITVLLSMILWMVLALILGLLESARLQAARAQLLAYADLGMFNLFAEYDRNLLEDYDVFFLDGGRNETGFQSELVKARLMYFCGAKDVEGKSLQEGAASGLVINGAELEAVKLATDDQGVPFLSQAAAYAKKNLLLELLYIDDEDDELIKSGERLLTNAGSISDRIEAIRAEAKAQAKADYDRKVQVAKAEGREYTEPLDLSKYEFDNPIKTLKRLLKMGVTVLAGNAVSGRYTDSAQLLSQRKQNAGWGVVKGMPETERTDGVWFNKYILDKLPCLMTEEDMKGSALAYQCEYVISGQVSDQENLEMVLKKILAIRFGCNYASLLVSEEHQAKAETLALAISSAASLPMLTSVMKAAIILLWAFEESIVDVRTLCSGGKVSLTKRAGDFTCSLEMLFSFRPEEAESSEQGMDYRGYLRWMLALVPLQERTIRCMDMIEHSIREKYGRYGFCMDTMVYAVRAKVYGSVASGIFVSQWGGSQLNTIVTGSYNEE